MTAVTPPRTVALVSGGLDSVTLAHHLVAEGMGPLYLVSVDYGQRHAKELMYAQRCAERLGAKHAILPLAWMKGFLPGSALTTDAVAVPDGHYAWDTMKQTVVGNRNMILLALAGGIAVGLKAQFVATAVHAGDHAIYPDCRPDFIDSMNLALQLGNEGFGHPELTLAAPFVGWSKEAIARRAKALDVPIEETWSCYKGGAIHCGRCGTCVERIEALFRAGVVDRTPYGDYNYAASVTL